MEIHLSFQWISVVISMKHQWKSIEFPVEISMICQWRFQWNANRNEFEIFLKFQWNTNGNPLQIQLKLQWNTNGNPLEIHFNPVEISMICQWKSIGYPVEISIKWKSKTLEIQLEFNSMIQWNTSGIKCYSIQNFNEIPLEIKLKFQWNTNGCSLEIQLKFYRNFQWNFKGNPF
jgi:hypothetical protein